MSRTARNGTVDPMSSSAPIHTPEGPESAIPSVAARVTAFVAILLGGLGGAVVGASFGSLQCDGTCTVATGLWLWVGSLAGAIGVAIVAVLTLRARGEWTEP